MFFDLNLADQILKNENIDFNVCRNILIIYLKNPDRHKPCSFTQMRTFCFIALFFISAVAGSQNPEIDSLQNVLKTLQEDTNKVYTLYRIGGYYYKIGEHRSCIEYGKKTMALAEKLNFTSGRLNAYSSLVGGYGGLGNYPEVLKNAYSSLKLAEDSGKKGFVGLSFQWIGSAHQSMGNIDDALENYIASLKIRQELNDSVGLGQSYNSIGAIYFKSGNYSDALSEFINALKIYQGLGERGPYWGMSWSYQNIADVHIESGVLANDVGKKTEAKNEFSEALKNSFFSLEIEKKHGNMAGTIFSYLQIGTIYMHIKKYSMAREYFEKSLQAANSTGSSDQFSDIYFRLSTTDSIRGDYKHAFQNYKTAVLYRDSLVGEERRSESVRIQMQYEFDKKEAAAKAEQDKKDLLTNAEISKQKVVRNFSVAGAAAILSLGGFVFYNFRKRKKLENEKALADERLRISRDLHDDMGASLSSISVFSSAVKQKLLNNEKLEAEQLLDRMSTDAQEMVSGMSEMVWTISPHNDTIEKLTDRLQLYAAGMLSAKNISFSLECEEELKNRKLPVELRKNIFLILKEAINNAVKYSGASEVKLTVSKKENLLVAVLADNGKGFEISDHENRNGKSGNGLRNMRQRAHEIQSRIIIDSEINKGTSVELACNI